MVDAQQDGWPPSAAKPQGTREESQAHVDPHVDPRVRRCWEWLTAEAHHADLGAASRLEMTECRDHLGLLLLPREVLDPVHAELSIRRQCIAISTPVECRRREHFGHDNVVALLGEAIRNGADSATVPAPYVREDQDSARWCAFHWRLVKLHGIQADDLALGLVLSGQVWQGTGGAARHDVCQRYG